MFKKETDRLIRQIVKHARRMIQAGMSQSSRTCGSASCGCHLDRNRRHGPHMYLTFRTAEGKNTAMYVAPEHVEEAKEAKRAWDEFWRVATEVAGLNREGMRARWQGAREARVRRRSSVGD